ncbi:hypothetical protein A0J61_09398 [Choanephora cucurbitarum]|uniref:Uncharacterized protein n=1 Tax=Choanephora cucurbitarum TaxID=101091 RepID=A0A1C7N1Q0_9FUNG|nr:hypothetical protein A0J61_09398 [Choanephora cucurbitarum]
MRYLLISSLMLSVVLATPYDPLNLYIDQSMIDVSTNENVVPMVVLNEADLPPPSLRTVRPNTHQRNQDRIDGSERPYKHMGMGIGYIKVAPLLPQDQMEFGFQREQWVASFLAQEETEVKPVLNETRKLKQLIGLSDKGETQTMDVPEYDNKSVVSAVDHKLSEQVDKVFPEGISEKKLVGMDQDGLMRFMNIPHYDRHIESEP